VNDTIVVLHSRRRERAQLVQKLQHAAPAVLLLVDGSRALAGRPSGFPLIMALALVVTSVLVLGSVVRSLRHQVRGRTEAHEAAAHHGVDWIDIFLAAMLAAEALAHWHETGHVRRPTVLTAIVMLALGCLHGPITARYQKRRALRVTERGIEIGGRWRTRFAASWDEIARIDIEAAQAKIVRSDGAVRQINLADLRNAHDVSKALERAREQVISRAAAPAGPA
jgi:hypothetical protein